MKFVIQNINKSVNDIMRQIGYIPAYFQNEGEFSMIRKVTGNDYPRFHLYIEETTSYKLKAESYIFNLHLDQKKPSYKGARGHSGDYDGLAIENEAERIKRALDFNS